MGKQRRFCLAGAVVLSSVLELYAGERYGFGVTKKSIVLERRLLPDVQLGNVSLAIVFPRGTGGIDGNAFASDLETQLGRSRTGIRLVSRGPDYEIRCYTKVLQPAHIVATTQPAPKWMGKSGTPTTEREAHGSIALDAQLVHTSDGRVIDAFSESVSLNVSSSAGANNTAFSLRIPGIGRSSDQNQAVANDPLPATETDASLNLGMIASLSLRVASHMVLMNERITVLLAQGAGLDEAAPLALNGRWTQYLEKLSEVPVQPDQVDNAYVLYDLGVANEALGYAASDLTAALKYLEASSVQYSKAAAARPSEKYFLEPQRRIETALTRYTHFAHQQAAAVSHQRQASSTGSAVETLTNADVEKMVIAHLDKNLISNKIATVARVEFDLTVDGLVALSKAGVPADLIALMTQRMQRQEAGQR